MYTLGDWYFGTFLFRFVASLILCFPNKFISRNSCCGPCACVCVLYCAHFFYIFSSAVLDILGLQTQLNVCITHLTTKLKIARRPKLVINFSMKRLIGSEGFCRLCNCTGDKQSFLLLMRLVRGTREPND